MKNKSPACALYIIMMMNIKKCNFFFYFCIFLSDMNKCLFIAILSTHIEKTRWIFLVTAE